MSLMNSREELPLDISPRLLHLRYDYVMQRWKLKKILNKNDCDTVTPMPNTYSSLKEVKLENDDGMGPVKPVPRICLQ